MQNSFPPVIMFNPNQIDAFSELFDLVVEGMQNTFKLMETGILFDIRTKNILDALTAEELNYLKVL